MLTSLSRNSVNTRGLPGGSAVKSLPVMPGDAGSIPGSERSPGGGYGNPLQYSCLEIPMDRGVWQAAVHGVTSSQTGRSDLARNTSRGQSRKS